jgi:hypothetical protein
LSIDHKLAISELIRMRVFAVQSAWLHRETGAKCTLYGAAHRNTGGGSLAKTLGLLSQVPYFFIIIKIKIYLVCYNISSKNKSWVI